MTATSVNTISTNDQTAVDEPDRTAGATDELASDAGPAPAVVAIPVPTTSPRPVRAAPARGVRSEAAPASDQSAGGSPAPAESAASPAPRPGLLRRVLSWPFRPLRRRGRVAHELAQAETAAAPPRGPLLLRILDRLLDLVNRPFEFLSPGARRAVGLASLMTLLISAMSAFLLPRLAPRHDAISFARQRRLELLAPPVHEAPEAPAQNSGGHGGGGH